MSHYAIRVTKPKEILRQLVGAWALRATHVVAQEHNDGESGRIHSHILLLGIVASESTIRKEVAKYDLSGNSDVSIKSTFKDKQSDTPKKAVPITRENCHKFITYMSKGKFSPWYVKEFSDEYIEELKSKWITYSSSKVNKIQMRFCTQMQYDMDDGIQKPTEEYIYNEAIRYAKSMTDYIWTNKSYEIAKVCFWTFCMDNKVPVMKWKIKM